MITTRWHVGRWLRRRRGVDDLGNRFVDFRVLDVPFVSKAIGSAPPPFGGTAADYDFWRPHMCAVCCVKSIGDALGTTTSTTLFDLITMSIELEVYRFDEHGDLRGAFHYPLRDLLRMRVGVPAEVAAALTIDQIKEVLAHGKVVLLSVDLRRSDHVRADVTHLVTVYEYDTGADTFRLHDCAAAIVSDGEAAEVPASYLAAVSNSRGLVVG